MMGILSSSISLDQVPASQRLEFWNEAICNTYLTVDCQPLKSASPLNGDIRAFAFDGLGLSRNYSPPMVYRRGSSEISRSNEEFFQVILIKDGIGYVEQDGKRVMVVPNDLIIYSSLKDSRLEFPDGLESEVLKVPRVLLEDRMANVADVAALKLERGNLPANLLSSLIHESISFDRGDVLSNSRVSGAMVDILATAIESALPTNNPSCRSSIAFDSVKAFIENNLTDPDLNVSKIARGNNISVRTLNRMFAAEGVTIMRWVWARRLARGYRQLTDGKHTQVSQVAFNCGFNDLSHFSKIFKARYGMSPNELLKK